MKVNYLGTANFQVEMLRFLDLYILYSGGLPFLYWCLLQDIRGRSKREKEMGSYLVRLGSKEYGTIADTQCTLFLFAFLVYLGD